MHTLFECIFNGFKLWSAMTIAAAVGFRSLRDHIVAAILAVSVCDFLQFR